MSNLLNLSLRHTANALKATSYRLLSRPLLVSTCREAVRAPACQVGRAARYCSRTPYDVNTSLTKDVILFKYDNPKFFRMINIFAICQFIFWNYLSHYAYTTLRDAPVVEDPAADTAWYERINLGENKYRNGLTAMCFLIGYGVLVVAWTYTLRSVRFLILRKGGADVSFVTYTPFTKNRIMTVPLKCISAQESRAAAKVQLPIKVRNKSLFYILDMRGEFRNGQLFDYTAGLNRRL